MRRFKACLILSVLVVFNVLSVLQQSSLPVAGNSIGTEWYTVSNGWINVTKNSYRWAARNDSDPNEFMFFYRYSNSTPFQSSTFGFIWTEEGRSTFKGKGTAYVVYNDADVLIYKRALSAGGTTITQYYTFWSDKEYFAWSSEINVTSQNPIVQFQVGIYALWQSGWTYHYRSMDYHNNSYLSSNSSTGDRGSNLAVTQGVIENNKAFPWQVARCNQKNETIGWIATYHSEPWLGIDAGLGGVAELQYSSYCMNPVISTSIRLQLPYCKRIDTIVYPHYGDGDNWHLLTKQLAEELYSTVTKPQSWAPWEYAFAQHDTTSYFRSGQIANKIGIFLFGDNLVGGFLLKNTSVWNYYPSVGYTKQLPFHFKYSNKDNPFVWFTNSSGDYVARADSAPTTYDTSSQSISTDSTEVKISWQWEDKNAQGNITMVTWGDSDKFDVTICFRNKIATNITDAFTNIRAINQINTIQFNEITENITADYTIQEPYGGYCGYLVKVLEGNHSWVDFSNSGIKINFIDNYADTKYFSSMWYVKLMFWAHFGQITSESEITGYHTDPLLADIQQHFARSAVNSSLFTPYDVWSASASLPIIKEVNSTAYKLLAIVPGTKTFTIFLNTTIFPKIASVSNVSSYEYDSNTGNFTFTGDFSGGKWIYISKAEMDNPPTYSNLGSSQTTAGQACKLYSYWNDDKGLSYYKVEHNNTGVFQNITNSFGGTPAWANETITLNSATGVVVAWRTHACDTADQWNTTGWQYVTTTSDNPPTYSSIGNNNTIAGQSCKLYSYWNDDKGLSYYKVEHNNTGIYENITSSFSSTPSWANETITLNSTVGIVVAWRVHANDTANQWNTTSWQYITISEEVSYWQFSFDFRDLDKNDVSSKITWRLYNDSQLLNYTQGECTLLDGTYTLKTFYHGIPINGTSLDTANYGNSTVTINLQMKPHTSVSGGYVTFNNTVTSITINSQTEENLTVTIEGLSPVWIIADVPRNCSYIQRNGENQTNWIFVDSTPDYVHLNSSQLSMWEFYFPFEKKVGETVFLITSNSTVSEVTFSSKYKILEFIVSGPSGTIGYTEVLISKTILENANELAVYLDGAEINHTVTSTDGFWLVYFEYEHSIHHVRIVFSVVQPIKIALLAILILLLVTGSLIGFFVNKRRRR